MSQTAYKTFDDAVETLSTFVACTRCGIDVLRNTVAKRAARGQADGYCRDCRATEFGKGGTNSRGVDICTPWRGHVDLDTMQPLNDKGEPHMPGIRTCGNADCCNKRHVIDFQALEAERHDLSYRTGKRLTVAAFMTALKQEAGQ